MNTIRNHTKEFVVLTALLALAVSVVNAAVFVYYPIKMAAQWTKPPIYFSKGTNADGPDVGAGSYIKVDLSNENTAAAIEVHPSGRGITYYKDVLRIINGGGQAYYIGFTVEIPFDHSDIFSAELIVMTTGGTLVGTIDLKKTGNTWIPWELPVNKEFRVDLRFTINSSVYPGDDALIYLVYSPQSFESPP